jgi:hypothetical protein
MDRGTALFPAYSANGIARGIAEAFAEIVALLFGARGAIDAEIRAAVEPHMAILLHKKARYTPQRWTKEVEDFVARTFFWPEPAATDAFGKLGRGEIARIVDRIVAEEQQRAVSPAALPATSSFDTSWTD